MEKVKTKCKLVFGLRVKMKCFGNACSVKRSGIGVKDKFVCRVGC